MFSQFADKSKNVGSELDRAYNRDIDIVPFIIDGKKPDNLDYYLRLMQWIQANGDYRKMIPDLITALKKKLGMTEVATQDNKKPIEPQETKASQKWPSAEKIEIETLDDKGGSKEDERISWKDRLEGAIVGYGAGTIVPIPGSSIAGALVGAFKPDIFASGKEKEEPAIETIKVNNNVSFNIIRVEGGAFRMGDPKQLEQEDAYRDTDPEPPKQLSTYYIGEMPVTQELWRTVMDSNPSSNKGDLQRPVENVTYHECQKFIQSLNELTGRKFRLPTEEEWEFAARGGIKSKGYKFAGSDNLDEVGWYYANSDEITHPVGMKRPNELGIFDMSGNVWEWCKSKNGSHRIYRGGCCLYNSEDCTVYCSSSLSPESRYGTGGFRLAL